MNPNPNLAAKSGWERVSDSCFNCGVQTLYFNEYSGEHKCNSCGYSFGGDE
jgi:rubredoxin